MREPTKHSPADRGQATIPGRCQICGAEGETIVVPLVPPPNQFCERCAIDYGESVEEEEPG